MIKKLLSFTILAVFVLAACRPQEKPGTVVPKPQPEEPQKPEVATISFSDVTVSSDAIKYDSSNDKLSVNFTDAEGSVSFKLKASDSWTIKALNDRADSWISVSPSSGSKGEATVKFSAKSNDTYDERSADFDITCGSVKKSVRVVQKQKDAILISGTKAEVSAEGGDLEIELQHNIDYTVEISEGADWIKKVETKGLSKVILSFEVEPNEGTKTREGSITVSSSAGSETVSVCQAGALPYIVIGQKEYNVDSDEHQIEVLVTSNTSISVRVEGSDWLLYEQTKASSTDKYVFRVKANTSYDSRTGRIVFFAGNGLEDEVVINQSALGALIIATDGYDVPSEGGSYSFVLSTNQDYKVSADVPWIHIIQTKGLSTHAISFTVDENTGYSGREGKVVVTSGGKTQDLTIRQSGFEPEIVLSQDEFNVDSGEHQIEVYVTRNAPVSYRIEGSDWIEVVQTKANTTDKYVFRVKANTSYDSRTGRIVFFAGNGLEDEVVINQSALGALIIATDRYEIPSEGGDYALELSTNFDYYDVSSNAFWISIIETKGLNKHTIRFFVDENTSVHERSGRIDIYIYAEDKMQSVTIIQKGKVQDYSVIAGSELFEPLSDATKEKITECYFFVNSDKTTSLEVPTNGRLGYPAYLELQGTVLNCYTKGSYYDVYSSRALFKDWKSLKTVKFTAWDFSNCYYCSEMFSGCTSLESLDLENIRNTGVHLKLMNYMFLDCTSLKSVDFSGWDTSKVEEMISVFQGCRNLESVNLKSFDTKNVTTLGGMFWGCESLKTVDLSSFKTPNLEGVSEMFARSGIKSVDLSGFDFSKVWDYNGMFLECPNLESLDLSSVATPAMTDARFIFSLCENLRSLDIRSFDFSKVPLDMFNYILQGVGENGTCTITLTNDAFRRLQRASDAAFVDENINWNIVDLHHSTDRSKDGKVVKLQSATKGNGIDIVFMGDSYSDILIADGSYEKDMRLAMEGFFMVEPYKSLRDHFNVYMQYVVSDTDLQSEGGKLNVQYTKNSYGDTYITGDYQTVKSYVKNVFPSANLDNITVGVISNTRRGGGTTFMDYPSSGAVNDYGQGFSVAYLPRQFAEKNFKYVLAHEMGGHGFGKLADEYSYSSNPTISAQDKDDYLGWSAMGWYKNVSLTTEPIKWQKFIDDPRYDSQELGAYPGGFTYSQSFYSPTFDSLMGSSTSGKFNAPSREAIYYRINKLAYGDSWKYDYETFTAFDLNL